VYLPVINKLSPLREAAACEIAARTPRAWRADSEIACKLVTSVVF
jgi:hypothetical protein